MASEFQDLWVPEGEVLFREGDEGDCAYVIETGLVQISVERNGQSIGVATLGPGEIFGEMAIISPAGRSATAIALEDCRLLTIEAQQFKHRIDALDPVIRMAIDVILSRFRKTLKRIEAAPPVLREIAFPRTTDMSEAVECLRLEREIATAIQEQQFVPYYQAIVCLETGKLSGFEALIRWNHPTRGALMPNTFVPVAEQSDLISQITNTCLQTVSHDLREMRLNALRNIRNVRPIFAAINVTGRDLDQPDFVNEVEASLSCNGLSADILKLEITESSLMSNLDDVRAVLTRLRGLGVGVAIDDFGTGYSSMSHLAELPISTLKIDQGFVTAIGQSEQNRKIVKTILRLAQELEIPVVAEGVESAEDAAFLAAHECMYAQGHFYSQPMPLSEALATIRNWSAQPASVAFKKQNLRRALAAG